MNISNIINYLNKYCPKGTLVWTRNTSNLSDLWTLNGHIKLISPRRLGVSYNVQGPDITLTPDPITIENYKNLLDGEQAAGSVLSLLNSTAVNNTMNYIGIFSTFQELYGWLKPTQNLSIPVQLTFSYNVVDNKYLVIVFQDRPTLIIHEMLTYNLAIKQLTLSDGEAIVDFDGSRLIKQRKYKLYVS